MGKYLKFCSIGVMVAHLPSEQIVTVRVCYTAPDTFENWNFIGKCLLTEGAPKVRWKILVVRLLENLKE